MDNKKHNYVSLPHLGTSLGRELAEAMAVKSENPTGKEIRTSQALVDFFQRGTSKRSLRMKGVSSA